MPAFICTTCGTQFAPSDAPPPACPICEDERQYVNADGQSWTTLDTLRGSHWNAFRRYEPGLFALGTFPSFAIGQRAWLVCTQRGNVLWDCVSLLDDATVDLIGGLGGLAAIAISHPHYYSTMVEWSAAFGDVPVHLHEADRRWVMREAPALDFWGGERCEILPGLTLVRSGGHYAGGTVLHWRDGAQGRGALLSGDILQVVPDRRHVGFMRSYPNLIPLSADAVRGIAASLDGLAYDPVYGAFWGREILRDGERAVAESVARHIAWVSGAAGQT